MYSLVDSWSSKIPRDLFISVAAVTDWKAKANNNKIKKTDGPPKINFLNNPDILKAVSLHKKRPRLVVGFAAETENLIKNAIKKLKQKKCDLIIANNVRKKDNVFGGKYNSVNIVNANGSFLKLSKMSKSDLSKKILKEAIYPLLN